jgi:hypothetical protein
MIKPTSCSHKPLLLVLLMLLSVVPFASAQEQSTNRATRQQLRIVSFQGDLRGLLGSLAETDGVVIGFETDPQSPLLVKVEARDVSFHQLLDVIVLGHPQYRWRNVDDSIEFFPVSGGSPVLDTVIRNFEVKDAHFSEATDTLFNLPEVRGSLAAMALTRNEEGYRPRTSGAVFSLRLEQVTVRRALHEIARKSGTNFWTFRQFGGKERFFSLRSSI